MKTIYNFAGFAVMIASIMLILVLIAGCAPSKPAALKLNVTGDSYCKLAEKIDWTIKDTKQTIVNIANENNKWDCYCRDPNGPECKAILAKTS
jgi:hypothetical protein